MLHDAGPVEEVPEGALRIVKLGKQEVGLMRDGDRVFAIRNVCPHQSAPLCAGPIRVRLDSGGVGRVASRRVPVVACPWHGWEFDVATGCSVWDEKYRAKTYETTVQDGRILVEIGGNRE